MKVKTAEAIEMVKRGESLRHVILEDIDDVRVNVRDALILNRGGVVIPEVNLYYDDEEIAYDEDIDDVDWQGPFRVLSEAEKRAHFENQSSDSVAIHLKTPDADVRDWLVENEGRLSDLLRPIVESLYRAEKMLKEG